jgi:hypothetical protein
VNFTGQVLGGEICSTFDAPDLITLGECNLVESAITRPPPLNARKDAYIVYVSYVSTITRPSPLNALKDAYDTYTTKIQLLYSALV